MKIRPATHADIQAILDIYNDAVLTTTATYDYEPRTLQHRMQWFEDHQKIEFPVFVAEEDSGRIVGWSSLSKYHDRPGYQFTCENSIYVGADARGKGIGKLLLAPLIESARGLGLRAIIAAIDATNAVSVRLHAGFGFVEVGRFPNVGFKFGRWLDVVYMELELPGPATPPPLSPRPAGAGL